MKLAKPQATAMAVNRYARQSAHAATTPARGPSP